MSRPVDAAQRPVDLSGDLDFSDDELVEMGVEISGRTDDRPKRKSRPMLRVPADEVTRPNASPNTAPQAAVSVAETLVDHAFANGGSADGVVPALSTLVDDSSESAEPELIDALDADEEAEETAEVEPEVEADDETEEEPEPEGEEE